MSAKTVLGTVLVAGWLACAAVHGQEPSSPPPVRGPAGVAAPGVDVPADPQPSGAEGPVSSNWGPPSTWCQTNVPPCSGPLSSWITYARDNCCDGPLGGNGQIMYEIFLRSGVSAPVGGGLVERELHPGWRIEAGGRSLFFDSTYRSAWTVDANIVNTENGGRGEQRVPLSILVANAAAPNGAQRVNFGQGKIPGVTIAGLNRTMVGVGLGKEWYLWEPANAPTNKWRVGYDFGGRYGSEKMDFNEIRHRTRVLENMYVALHTDYEISCGGRCTWYAGFRFEWDYTWSTILQTQHDLQDLNMLLTLGVRY